MDLALYAYTLLSICIFIIISEQATYLRKKGSAPGPYLVVPFLGNALSMVRNPTAYWHDQASAALSSPLGLSANLLFGRFVVFLRDSGLSQKVFANVRSGVFHLIGHPFGKKLFGEHNLIYMLDHAHKDLRRRLAPNFTPRALATYLPLQSRVIVSHLVAWGHLANAGNAPLPIPLRLLSRDLSLETSQTVFVGPYLPQNDRLAFKNDYNLFNVGLMKLPIDLPGFAFWRARLAVGRLVDTLSGCAAKSKERMRAGDEPSCLMDFWMAETVKEIAEAEKAGMPAPPDSSDREVAGHVFDFLFASQDASTSSLLWAVTLLDSHPDVLARVREEQAKVRPTGSLDITLDQLREMKYTEMVAKEVVRIRPPATLVPHVAACDFPITEGYTIPKGTIVFPSVYESSFQGFTEPEKFDPDRFSGERQEDQVFKQNWLPFGAGPHHCIGQRTCARGS
ncbi:cytochrome P450 710A1 isoform X2 [Amborella trichopoda]|uniref:cytochrome P450 710A1 isoform X2 n=1 Tax=Amborella trichopoda TaxID=13333 RepID=UPI0009BECF92|nr:cytochrome P450 710A1 isoform X2 [Amborella trichopoda]|eukprot:XP_020523479.1 cytochrome P450 710A1 isoform X2 [Amborella trichopoda]